MAMRRRPLPIQGATLDTFLPMENRSVRDQVERYLIRMRYSVPFPVTTDDCYFGCLPETVKRLERAGTFSSKMAPGKANNMLLTMNHSTQPLLPDNVLHISAEGKQDYIDAMQGVRGHERMFWVKITGTYPTPYNSTENPFYLPPDHPNYAAISGWVSKAYLVETEIELSLKAIEHFAMPGMEAGDAVQLWPELANFLVWPKGHAPNIRESVRYRASKALTALTRERVITHLTKATMLPENPPPLTAWVRFYTREI